MSTVMDRTKTVQRGRLLSCSEAGDLLGISDQLVRLAIRMKLIHAERVASNYVIRSEQLALVSERYHADYYTDFPVGRYGTLNRVILE